MRTWPCHALFALTGRNTAAAVLLGVAIHWRLFPVIYTLPVMLWLSQTRHRAVQKVSEAFWKL